MNLRSTFDGTFQIGSWGVNWADSYVHPHVGRVSVWSRWVIASLAVFGLTYRSEVTYSIYSIYVVLLLSFIVANAIAHRRIHSGKEISSIWFLILSIFDLALITVGSATSGGFGHFFFLLYYPALTIFALSFPSLRLCLCWVTLAASAYILPHLTASIGPDFQGFDDRVLIVRIAVMYFLVIAISFVSRFERTRWREAVNREQLSQREDVEYSKVLHDTTAQSVYMVALGVERLKAIIDTSEEAQTSLFKEVQAAAESAMWELRHPIDRGRIVEGRELSRTLASHAETFTAITAIPAEMTRRGQEPQLSTEVKARLFSIAHNAITNAYRHSNATGIQISLEFRCESISLEIADDGVGLPEDYLGRGHGFENMRAEARKLNGQLLVNAGGEESGTRITCVVPYASDLGVHDNVVR